MRWLPLIPWWLLAKLLRLGRFDRDFDWSWQGIIRTLVGDPVFDLARKEAIESGEDLASQAKRLLAEQTEYFNLHKDEKGQDRAEPK